MKILSGIRSITTCISKKLRVTSPTGMGSPFDSKQEPEFQLNIFSNDRDIRKCQSCRTQTTTSPRRRRRQGYDNTSTFSLDRAELKSLKCRYSGKNVVKNYL